MMEKEINNKIYIWSYVKCSKEKNIYKNKKVEKRKNCSQCYLRLLIYRMKENGSIVSRSIPIYDIYIYKFCLLYLYFIPSNFLCLKPAVFLLVYI